MARGRRFAPAGYAYHVGNRGNERRRIFHESADYKAFLQLMRVGKDRYPVKLYGVGLVPNHFHWVIVPEREGALSAYAGWVTGGYARYLRSATGTIGHGHVFQERFWNRGIADSWELLSVLSYVEANPLKARLVRRAEDWPWSSLALRRLPIEGLLDPLPVGLPENWIQLVNDDEEYE